MPLAPEKQHQILQISQNYRIAFKKVNYDEFDLMEKKIEDSFYTFDNYYRSISNLNRKFEWLSIRSLLMDIGNTSDIEYDEHGKPHFKGSDAHLSISHSTNSIAVSIHNTSAHGIDLQHLNPKIRRIKNKFLVGSELELIDTNNIEELSVLWSMKEALFKLNGKKDIFLKQNIRIDSLEKSEEKFIAKARIIGIEEPKEATMEALLLKDFVLAYTLIP